MPDGAHLGQNQPPLGGLDVLRHHQQHHVPGAAQPPGQVLPPEILGHQGGEGGPQGLNPFPGGGAHRHRPLRKLLGQLGRSDQIPLGLHHQKGGVLLGELLSPPQILFAGLSCNDQQGHVRPLEGVPGGLHPQLPQLPLVVIPGGVDEQHRADGVELHGLFHRVGGGARHRGHQGHLLTGEGVDEAGFSRIAPPVQGDVQPLGGGGLL